MSAPEIELVHPDLPDARYSCQPHQVDAWRSRGWLPADEQSASPAAPAVEAPAPTPRASKRATSSEETS